METKKRTRGPQKKPTLHRLYIKAVALADYVKATYYLVASHENINELKRMFENIAKAHWYINQFTHSKDKTVEWYDKLVDLEKRYKKAILEEQRINWMLDDEDVEDEDITEEDNSDYE